jgi:hypothetical protein
MSSLIVKLIRPRVITIFMFFLIMVYSLLLASTGSGTWTASRGETTFLMGIGPCLEINKVYVDEKKIDQSIEIHWLNLFLNIAVSFVVALLITHLVGKFSRWLLSIVIIVLFLAFMGSTIWSKNYWGYFIRRPRFDKRITKWEKVLTVTPVSTQTESDDSKVLVVNPNYSISDRIEDGKKDRYHDLEARILIALKDSGKLPESPEYMDAELLRSLHERLDSSGLLIEGYPGYDDAKVLRGIVIEAIGKDKKPNVLVAVKGYEVSNDHRPYYEYLFEADYQTYDLRLLSRRQSFYDLAGIEGLEWYIIFPCFSGVGLLISVPIILVIIPLIRLIRNLKESSAGKPSVLGHLRWGILFALVYFIVALSCYLIYLSNKHEYSIPMFIFYYASYPVYVVCALLLRIVQHSCFMFFYYYKKLMPITTILFFTTVFYFGVGQGLAYMFSKLRTKKNSYPSSPD